MGSIHFRRILLVFFFALLALSGMTRPSPAEAARPVVQAVLFYRSTCGHCMELVTTILPPILKTYGDSLQIFYADASKPEGDALFSAAIDHFQIKTIGVPTLIVGQAVLIGSDAIKNELPGKIDAGLKAGGLPWPEIPGLTEVFATAGSMTLPVYSPPGSYMSPLPTPVPTPASAAGRAQAQLASMQKKFKQDPLANSLSTVVLIGMVTVGLFGAVRLRQRGWPVGRPGWWMPALCLAGMGVSAYLAYVELKVVPAICGPVGNCEAVQSSAYARLFGFLPMGLAGLGGYALIAAAWAAARWGRAGWSVWAGRTLVALTGAGLLFSIYLTFLEPFVIGATCMWCLSSAVVMTLLFGMMLRSLRQD